MMNRHPGIVAMLMVHAVLLTLAACTPLTMTPNASDSLFGSSVESQQQSLATPCESCPEATLNALLTQEKSYSDAQAAATAAIMQANAQATLNASRATLGAAQTQEQNDANIIAAEVAATAAIVRANAQATLVAANSTQSAAQTQDAIRQTQAAELATAEREATLTQQNKDDIAARTQTAVANHVATQAQAARATSQWYTDQERQREEERQQPLTFLWLYCPPIFIIATSLIFLAFFWRWMKLRETQRRLEDTHADAAVIIQTNPGPTNHLPMQQFPLAKATGHIGRWLSEVRHKLITGKKEHDEPPDR
jgi:nitrogen fixation/metabolism regulation signal transduction histidine kinase